MNKALVPVILIIILFCLGTLVYLYNSSSYTKSPASTPPPTTQPDSSTTEEPAEITEATIVSHIEGASTFEELVGTPVPMYQPKTEEVVAVLSELDRETLESLYLKTIFIPRDTMAISDAELTSLLIESLQTLDDNNLIMHLAGAIRYQIMFNEPYYTQMTFIEKQHLATIYRDYFIENGYGSSTEADIDIAFKPLVEEYERLMVLYQANITND